MNIVKKLIRKSWPKVRIVNIKGQNFYQVDARRQGTNGKRESFSTRKEAETRATEIESEFKANGADGLTIPAELRVMALNCAKILEPHGKTINDATAFFKAWLDNEEAKRNSKTASVLADEWYSSRKNDGNKELRPQTLDGIRKHSQLLASAFGEKRILDITEQDIQDYLDGLSVGKRRKYNLRSLTSQFFNWCIKRKYIKENPAKDIEIEVPSKDVSILSVEKCAQFLNTCERDFRDLTLYVAISLFAGLRPAECALLKWESINIEERQITVLRETSKVSETRNVPIENSLLNWLKCNQGERKGFVTNQTNLTKRLQRLRLALGFKLNGRNLESEQWVEDYFRHTYASYWLGKYKDRAHLAENMGNSIQVIKKHYKRTVSGSDTERFWSIVPQSLMYKAREEENRHRSRFDEIKRRLAKTA